LPRQLIVVAGPNGAGKSTYSRTSFESGFLLLDPDRYGIRPDHHDPIAAGRLAVMRVRSALANGESLVLETTLSGRFPRKVIADAVRAGYRVSLLYIGLDDPDECIRRVQARVSQGGHDVPNDDVRRRYYRSLGALPKAIADVDLVALHDNGREHPYRLIARSDFTTATIADDVPQWARDAVAAVRTRCGRAADSTG
jgi:predicted ABC-type ATPase